MRTDIADSGGEQFRDAGFFLLRTPLLPVEAFERWSSGLSAGAAELAGEPLAAAVAADRSLLRSRLRAIIDDPVVAEAVYIASPSLSDNLRYWREDPDGRRGRRVERALVSYFGRMCVRSTPFGLFSGVALGRVAAASALALRGRAEHRRRTRLDKPYLFAIAEDLQRDASLRRLLVYRPNGTLHRCGAVYRYTQAALDRFGLTHRLVEVEGSELVEMVVVRAARGAGLMELADAVVATDPAAEITAEAAQAFVSDLIDAEVLVSDLTPNVTGGEPGDEMVRQLERLPAHAGAVRVAALLTGAKHRLAVIDRQGLGVSPARYREILPSESELAEVLTVNLLRSWPEERQFQVDLLPVAERLTLSTDLVAQLRAGAELLHRLRGRTRDVELQRFRDAFVERYQDAEVPLLEALDEDAGVGFARSESPHVEVSPLLDGIAFPREKESPEVHWGERERYLYRRLAAALLAGEREIVLGAADIERLSPGEALPLPDAWSVAATVVGSQEELRSGVPRIHIEWLDGPPSARTFGRFCHVDAGLCEAVVNHLRDEEAVRPEVLFAEVVHQPQGRAANIVCRPVLRGYELTYLGRSGAREECQIPVAEVTVSVAGEEIRLRSRRHDREIAPRLTCAHNPEVRGLGLYRFLVALQRQGCAGGALWHWGPLADAPFLPRVTSGLFILSLARWRLSKEQTEPLTALGAAGRFAAVQRLRRELGLPRVVAATADDEYLPLDLTNVLSVDAFVHLAARGNGIVLREMLTAPRELCVESPEGLLAHELIVPFVRQPRAGAGSVAPHRGGGRQAAGPALPVKFGPGSSWLDARLSCSAAAADRVLRRVAVPLVGLGVAESWFFVRQGGREFQLQLRFAGAARRLQDELLPALQRLAGELLAKNDLRRWSLDTYEREVERWGGPQGIELAEALFALDSDAALGILGLFDGTAAAEARWLLALRGSDLVLDDLGFDLAGKLELSRELAAGLSAEFGGDGRLRQSLAERYRAERGKLEALFAAQAARGWLGPALSLLARRSELARPVVEELRRRSQDGQLTVSLRDLAKRLLSAHAGRLLATAPAAHQLVICDLLQRMYESQVGRQRAGARPGTDSRGARLSGEAKLH